MIMRPNQNTCDYNEIYMRMVEERILFDSDSIRLTYHSDNKVLVCGLCEMCQIKQDNFIKHYHKWQIFSDLLNEKLRKERDYSW